ncbi:hypothetical protein BCR43DRAFT_460079 [Syncephalastrum racemosum]|uniref:NEDD8-activating enzyme E1 regulatory subunit n=1 Tax=Syncephalastrum racemosum TaxID=13706 RepID=A0A1X2H7B9_SYNRA|nr:hypothetical protein BCR43DRAFT_460079 [Syncephalastrum racemosum]
MTDLKTRKYDRQLRLWAASGQTALENSKIALLNATTTGCEILKNLVLPGVGDVTVVDGSTVTEMDIKTNFFLDAHAVGQPKAESAAALLKELNSEVNVQAVNKSPEHILHNDPAFFDTFSVIIATNLHDEETLLLSDICEKGAKTFVSVRCKGFCSLFRVQAPEHHIIEPHTENVVDLRLGNPFTSLRNHAKTYDLDTLDQTDHGHVPFVIVLIQTIEKWKEEHMDRFPSTYQERNEIKAMLKDKMRTPDEENYEEALANVFRLSSTSSVTPAISRLFQDPACENIDAKSAPFWIVARAVRDFVANEGEGELPLAGKLPDMKADTNNYVALQNIYRQKALQDIADVTLRVRCMLQNLQLPESTVPKELIETFCRNSANVNVIRYRTLREELTSQSNANKLLAVLKSDPNAAFSILFRASDRFFKELGHYPGAKPESAIDDVEPLKTQMRYVLHDSGIADDEASTWLETEDCQRAIQNFIRFANKEVPNIAALAGGLVSQEVIKLITHQYTPINNTCIFNGITSTSSVLEL